MEVFFDKDCRLEALTGQKIGVIGYGNQGRAQALNLRDGGFAPQIGLRLTSPSRLLAQSDGLVTMDVFELVKWADIVMVMIPDEEMPALFAEILKDLTEEKIFGFAHGFCLHFEKIRLKLGQSAFLVAPKGPGAAVRLNYEQGIGIPCLVAVTNDCGWEIAFAYASAIGGGKAGLLKTTFREETECDLFGEQVVLCGGLPELIRASFNTLVRKGFSPYMAYFECLHETKLIADLMHKEGIAGMRRRISNTAEYGSIQASSEVFDPGLTKRLDNILSKIQDGSFANEFLAEMQSGGSTLVAERSALDGELIEIVGKEIRSAFAF